MTAITIIGHRWFNRREGNTYHRAIVLVDGRTKVTSEITYGYGAAYEQTALELLQGAEIVPPDVDSLRRWATDNGVTVESHVVDVGRKADL